ncbi:MAG: HAD family hydrolase [Anaerolineae bacterium]|nr:HAD family hydrolase [Anaerolineae bacterium]
MHPAIFLDRDGVINENRADYVRRWQDVIFIPQAINALQAASHLPHKIIVVTNQSAIGRGILTLDDAAAINQQIIAAVQNQGGRIDGVLMCPHAPQARCTCRKPQPGLLLQAAQLYQLDLSQSIMVGDALTDIQAGRAAGVRAAALVLTGRGAGQANLPDAAALHPFPIYPTLQEALAALVTNAR